MDTHGVPEIKTGDLIGFSADGFLGFAINAFTLGWPFPPRSWRGLSHVGLVVSNSDGIKVWESTALYRKRCIYCGEIHDGLQLHPLLERVDAYPGAVWHCPLKRSLDRCQRFALSSFFHDNHAAPYDYLGAFQARTLLGGWLAKLYSKADLRALYCSENCAAAWWAAGVWDAPNPSRWSPNGLYRTARDVGIVGRPIRMK